LHDSGRFSEGGKIMSENRSLLGSGLGMLGHNKRYIGWFWLLNLTLAELGAAAFRKNAHAILDHSLYSSGLVHGFDLGVLTELLFRPEMGQTSAMFAPAMYFGFLFLLMTALFLPGVFAGYASNYRLPREDFFRACGRNLWRFIRILIIAGIVMGIVAGILFGINGAIATKAAESNNEVLPFELRVTGLAIIFLIMTTLRIWFDLAEADTALSDQRAVRKSIAAGFRHTFRSLGRLLASYVLAAIIAVAILLGGLWTWMKLVSPESLLGAFVVAQLTLFLLLIPRFWQRGVAVSYWKQKMVAPIVVGEPSVAEPIPQATIPAPLAPAPPVAEGT